QDLCVLLQRRNTRLDRWRPAEAIQRVVDRVSTITQTDDQTMSAPQLVEAGSHLGQHRRLAIANIEHERHQHKTMRGLGERAERSPHFERAGTEYVVQACAVVAETLGRAYQAPKVAGLKPGM